MRGLSIFFIKNDKQNTKSVFGECRDLDVLCVKQVKLKTTVMKKILLLLSVLLVLVSTTQAQLWQTQIVPMNLPPVGYEMSLKGYDLRETSDGNYVYAGRFKRGISPNFEYAPTLVKLEASTGQVLWRKDYDVFAYGNMMQEVSVVEKANGNLLLAGLINGGIFLIETDQQGDTVSTHRLASTCELINAPINCIINRIRLRATMDGNYVIGIGAVPSFIGFNHPINELIKINPANQELWRKTYAGHYFQDMQPTSDGGYVMIGFDNSYAGLVFKTDMNGDSLWQQSYIGGTMEHLNSIKETTTGDFVFIFNQSGIAGYTPMLAKINSTGTMLWQQPIGGYIGRVEHLIIDGNGNYTTTGYRSAMVGGVMDDVAFVAKLDPNGMLLQDQTFDVTAGNSGKIVRYTSDGNFVMGGNYDGSMPQQDFGYVVKTGYTLSSTKLQKDQQELTIFPNPFQSITRIQLNQVYDELCLHIYDALGRLVKTVLTEQQEQIVLERDHLNAGVYYLEILSEDGLIGTGKVVVE